jgi:hypothetical protein
LRCERGSAESCAHRSSSSAAFSRRDLAVVVHGLRIPLVDAKAERPAGVSSLTSLTVLPLSAPLTTPSTVMAAREALLDLADALTDPSCTSVQGVARVSWMLFDIANSPRHARIPARMLQRVAYEAVARLHGQR